MRLSELSGKEVINLGDGARLGIIEECEFSFDDKTGRIHSLLLPNRSGVFNFFSDHRASAIPWQAIKRIGNEVVIVDLSNSRDDTLHHYRERRENTY